MGLDGQITQLSVVIPAVDELLHLGSKVGLRLTVVFSWRIFLLKNAFGGERETSTCEGRRASCVGRQMPLFLEGRFFVNILCFQPLVCLVFRSSTKQTTKPFDPAILINSLCCVRYRYDMPLDQAPMISTHNSFNSVSGGSIRWEVCAASLLHGGLATYCSTLAIMHSRSRVAVRLR